MRMEGEDGGEGWRGEGMERERWIGGMDGGGYTGWRGRMDGRVHERYEEVKIPLEGSVFTFFGPALKSSI